MKLLIVEDDNKLRTELARFFPATAMRRKRSQTMRIWKRRSGKQEEICFF